MATAKKDSNGWLEVSDNKLSKPGIFDYYGHEIHPSLEPNRVYKVLRPIEELEDPECAESFKLRPWILRHTMLGNDFGVDAEEVGIHGIVGERVYFDPTDCWLKGNIKAFTKALEAEIKKGNDELSLGYGCQYEFTPGVLDGSIYKPIPGTPLGAQYDIVQKQIRGNHLASVDQSRMDVAVFDRASGMDSLKIKLPNKDTPMTTKPKNNKPKAPVLPGEGQDQEMSLAEVAKAIAGIVPILQNIGKAFTAMNPAETPPAEPAASEEYETDGDMPPNEADSEDENTPPDDKKEEAMDAKTVKTIVASAVNEATKPLLATIDKLKGENASMDQKIMKDIAERDKLAETLSFHIGAFDHKSMNLTEVAKYGVDKIGIKCEEGEERSALKYYLLNRQAKPNLYTLGDTGQDGSSEGGGANPIDEYMDN